MKKVFMIIGGAISTLILAGIALSMLSCDKEIDEDVEEVEYTDDDCIDVIG